MRLLETLKGLTSRAKQTAAAHADELHKAVEKAETLSDQRTQGKYHDQIQNAGAKVDAQVDDLAGKRDEPPAASTGNESKPE